MKSHINAAGVALPAVGAFLVWCFVADREAYLRGEGFLEITNPSPKDIKKLRFIIGMSRVGLGLS